ncbi:30S ribosomal protein S2 [Candidatus Berkelbacteria bacterium]|nr:30S ribosomal protein S2 [Candidatus Berkelbacteria bacterium]
MPKAKSSETTLPTLRELVDAGAHFGHRRSRSYPAARQYTYAVRDRLFVINLEATREKLGEAMAALEAMAAEGQTIMFVGTKPQAAEAIKTTATIAGMPYVNQRWLGGTLTNFTTIRANLEKLNHLTSLVETQEFEQFSKRDRGQITKQLAKLERMFTGMKDLNGKPDALIVVDITEEDVATAEANSAGIPIIGIVDTNANPNLVTHPIPANDDSRRTIELILNLLAEAIVRGKAKMPAPAAPVAETATKAEQAEQTHIPTSRVDDVVVAKPEEVEEAPAMVKADAPVKKVAKKAPAKKPTAKKATATPTKSKAKKAA